MFESKELRVKPVRRYCTPRYPSHTDPDPTLHPTPVPYPASNKLLAAVAAVGMAASTSCSEPAPETSLPAAANVSAPLEPIKPPAENPFRVALSGLPFRGSSFGTGQPMYMNEHHARAAIDRAFQAAGYDLERDCLYRRGEVMLVADGYDAEKKIGYVLGCSLNLADDALIRAPRNPVDLDTQINELLHWATGNEEQTKLVEDIQAAKLLPDPARREAAYRSIVEYANRHEISLAEMKLLEQPAKNHQDFIAVVSIYDRRFYVPWNEAAVQREIEKLGPNPTPEQRRPVRRASRDKFEQIALEKLQQAVREYIAWARSQGAQ